MAIKIGNKNISAIKYGSKNISKVYMGSKQVFPEAKETLIAVLDYTLYGDMPWTNTKRISYPNNLPKVSGSTTTTFTYDGIKYENTVAWSFDLHTKDITITYNNSEPQTLQIGQSYAFEANNPYDYKTLITYTSYDEGANKFVLTINEEYKEQTVEPIPTPPINTN